VAALDLILALIGRAHGPRLAQVVTNAFVHNQPRPAETPQRTDAAHGSDEQTMLRRALRMMTEHIEFRMNLSQICADLQVSRRRLERTFLKETGRSPAATYLDIRLEAARDQLFYSGNSIGHIAEVTGFQSDAHFCRAFRKRFGASPSIVRRDFQADRRSKYYPVGTRLVPDHTTAAAASATPLARGVPRSPASLR
jgi:AraC family carnitine catabolism transcriptional activator